MPLSKTLLSDKTFFQYDMAYGYFRDLHKRTSSEKKLNDKASNIAKNSKYYGYQHRLASMLYDGLLIKTLLVMLLHVHGQRP